MATIRFFFDEHMRRRVADVLIERGIDVVLAADVNMRTKDDDSEILPYATEQGLVVVTFDRPFAGRTAKRSDHAGLICPAAKFRGDIGGLIQLLAEFAETHTLDDTKGQVFWLGS
jgi:uncharacterized protein DUF5615